MLLSGSEFVKIQKGPFVIITDNKLSQGPAKNLNFYNFTNLNIPIIIEGETGPPAVFYGKPDRIFYGKLNPVSNNLEPYPALDKFPNFLAEIQIPADSLVCTGLGPAYLKCSKPVILNCYPFPDHPLWDNLDLCAELIKYHCKFINFTKRQNSEIIKSAISYFGGIRRFEVDLTGFPELINWIMEKIIPNISDIPNWLCQDKFYLDILKKNIFLAWKIKSEDPCINYWLSIINNYIESPTVQTNNQLVYTDFRIGDLYSGTKFMAKFYKKKPFVIITTHGDTQDRLAYKNGLNIYPGKFMAYGESQTGGIYFTELYQVGDFLDSGIYMREVQIPADALVYCQSNQFKSNKLILGERELIQDHPLWKNPTAIFETYYHNNKIADIFQDPKSDINFEKKCQKNPRYIISAPPSHQNITIAKLICGHEGALICYIRLELQTDEVCLLALKNNLHAIWQIKNPKFLEIKKLIGQLQINQGEDTMEKIKTELDNFVY